MIRLILFVMAGLLSVSSGYADNKSPPSGKEKGAEGTPAAIPQKPPKVVMAVVDGQEITVEHLMQAVAKNPTRVEEAMTPAGKASLLRDMIANILIIRAMRKEALLSDKPTEQEVMKAHAQFTAKHYPKPPVPDDKVLQAYYDSHQSAFGIPAMVRLAEIQFRPGPHGIGSAEEKVAAKQRAEAALARVNKGEDFGTLADELTENPQGKGKKGDSGFLAKEKYAWLDQAIKGLKVGEHTGIIESPGAYHILKVTDERPSLIPPFSEVRDQVINAYLVDEQKKARQIYLRTLAKDVPVEIKLDELKPEFAQGIFP